jgi:histone H3/H4
MVTIRTQVKDIVKEAGIDNIAGDFMDKLDEKAKQLVLDAVKRAKENGRRTVMGKDI